MRIPKDEDERHRLYRNLIRYCEASQSRRRAHSRRMRQFYLTGSDQDAPTRYNKLMEHVLFSSAYVYSQKQVKLGVSLPARYGDAFVDEEQVVREEAQSLWDESGAGEVVGTTVTWAHVWETAVVKLITDDNRPIPVLVPDPSDIGVLREDLNDLKRQEAVCHWFNLDLARFDRFIKGHPDATNLMYEAELNAVPGYEAHAEMLPPTVNRIILAAAAPNMIGAVNATPELAQSLPNVREPIVRLCELWVYDDELEDYRVVVNFLAREQIIQDYPNPLLRRAHPFYGLSLQDVPGYLWGRSPMQALLGLQVWREQKMEALDLRDQLQLDPPIVFQGMSTIDGEKAKAFRRPGGNIMLAMPTASATPMIPPPLPDPFEFVEQIDTMFAKMGGLPRGMTGDNIPGVRSGDQVMAQAALGAGPTENRAMRVEGFIGTLGTAMLKLHRQINKVPLKKPDGQMFLLSQFPEEAKVTVWGHSASPLYAEKTLQKAVVAKQLSAIDAETFLDYIDLPQTEELKARARQMAQSMGGQQAKVIGLKERELDIKQQKANSEQLKALKAD